MENPVKVPVPSTSDPVSRRTMLSLAGRASLSVVVSQAMVGCGATSGSVVDTSAGSAAGSCVVSAALTEGPFFVDEKLERSDIRADPATGVVSAGAPLAMRFNVSRVGGGTCTPLTGAYLDVWHCDAGGLYSNESSNGTAGRRFLRGHQITDAAGQASFTTIYPGWYPGRAVHVHFKLRLFAGTAKTYEFTSQFFFDDAISDAVYAEAPYAGRGARTTRNSNDGIFNGLSANDRTALTLVTARTGGAFSGVIGLGVRIG